MRVWQRGRPSILTEISLKWKYIYETYSINKLGCTLYCQFTKLPCINFGGHSKQKVAHSIEPLNDRNFKKICWII